MSKIRFYLDENIDNAIAKGLRLRGIDVLTTPEAEHMSWDDEDHLAFALAENRVFVTQDTDFLVLASQEIAHAGIAYYHPQSRTIKEILFEPRLLYEALTGEEMRNQVRFL